MQLLTDSAPVQPIPEDQRPREYFALEHDHAQQPVSPSDFEM